MVGGVGIGNQNPGTTCNMCNIHNAICKL